MLAVGGPSPFQDVPPTFAVTPSVTGLAYVVQTIRIVVLGTARPAARGRSFDRRVSVVL